MDRHSEIVLFKDGLWYLDQSCQVQNLFQYPPLDTQDIFKFVVFLISTGKFRLSVKVLQ